MGAGSTPPPIPSEDAPADAIQSQDETDKDLRESEDGVVTTLEELNGFHIIRAIVCNQVDVSRVTYRDAKTYCAVLLDDNNRKSIARLHFNRSQKYIGIFDEDKKETRQPIDSLEQIYALSDDLRATVERLNA